MRTDRLHAHRHHRSCHRQGCRMHWIGVSNGASCARHVHSATGAAIGQGNRAAATRATPRPPAMRGLGCAEADRREGWCRRARREGWCSAADARCGYGDGHRRRGCGGAHVRRMAAASTGWSDAGWRAPRRRCRRRVRGSLRCVHMLPQDDPARCPAHARQPWERAGGDGASYGEGPLVAAQRRERAPTSSTPPRAAASTGTARAASSESLRRKLAPRCLEPGRCHRGDHCCCDPR